MFSSKSECMLDAKRFGLAAGILWGLAVFVLTLIAHFTGLWLQFMDTISYIYPGYKVSLIGSLVGTAWAFVDAFVGFYIFAWLYNKLGSKK